MKYRRYIKGSRKGKEANRIEREAMKDPFLAEALEGYERIPNDQQKRITDIRKQVVRRAQRRNYLIRNLSAVACLLMLLGFGGYFFFSQNELPQEIATVQQEILHEEEQQQPVEPLKIEKAIALNQKEEKKETPPPPPPVPVPSQKALTIAEDNITVAEEDMAVVEMEIAMIEKDAMDSIDSAISDTPSTMIKGKVFDDNGKPLIGASVYIDGTSRGTITNLDGFFKLEALDTGNINVNLIGYKPVKISADATTPMMHIAMHKDETSLDEVTVVGYGRQKKSLMTGSIQIVMPQPVIGKKAYDAYIEKNLIRPTDEICKKKRGTVGLTFYINTEGRPYQIKVEKPLCEQADNEAIRLIEEGPDWIIGDKEVKWEVRF